MTTFQVLALGFLAVSVAAAYGKNIAAAVRKYVPTPAAPSTPKPATQTAANCVSDMITVAEMRDRLRAINCHDGVEACTYLLKVLVEFKYPQG